MRTKELLGKISDKAPCLACEPALGKMQQEGLSDFVYALRKVAEQLWESESIDEDTRFTLNDHLADLVRRMSGEEERKESQIDGLLENIEKRISSIPLLVGGWHELRDIINETRNP